MSYNDLALSELLHVVWYSLGPSMLLQMAVFHYFFNGKVIFYCIHIPFLISPLSVDGHFRLLSCVGYYKEC